MTIDVDKNYLGSNCTNKNFHVFRALLPFGQQTTKDNITELS